MQVIKRISIYDRHNCEVQNCFYFLTNNDKMLLSARKKQEQERFKSQQPYGRPSEYVHSSIIHNLDFNRLDVL